MKWTLIAAGVLLAAASAGSAADGTVVFNNRIGGILEAPIFGPELTDSTLWLHGNDRDGVPAGITVYTGSRLGGTDYFAELWYLPPGELEFSAVPEARTTFRVSAAGAGFIIPLEDPSIPGVSAGERVMLQLRAWDNEGATITDWETAARLGAARGSSLAFLSEPLGGVPASGNPISSPNLTLLTSFNIAVPEPESTACVMVGALGIVILIRHCRASRAPFAPQSPSKW